MNRFKNRLLNYTEYAGPIRQLDHDAKIGVYLEDELIDAQSYQDLYDMLADDYRGGYHGERKTKLLLYIAHRAYREYGVVIHTGNGFAPLDSVDTHHGDPADISVLCEDYSYDYIEQEEIREYLIGIR